MGGMGGRSCRGLRHNKPQHSTAQHSTTASTGTDYVSRVLYKQGGHLCWLLAVLYVWELMVVLRSHDPTITTINIVASTPVHFSTQCYTHIQYNTHTV